MQVISFIQLLNYPLSGYLHLWEDTQEKDATFNSYSRPTEFASEV